MEERGDLSNYQAVHATTYSNSLIIIQVIDTGR